MNLKELRQSKGMTQQEFADTIGLARPRVTEYETKDIVMSAETAHKIVQSHNVTASIDAVTGKWIFSKKATGSCARSSGECRCR